MSIVTNNRTKRRKIKKHSSGGTIKSFIVGNSEGLYTNIGNNAVKNISSLDQLHNTRRWKRRIGIYNMYMKTVMIRGIPTPFISWKFILYSTSVDFGITGNGIAEAIQKIYPEDASRILEDYKAMSKSRTIGKVAPTFETPKEIILTPGWIMFLRNDLGITNKNSIDMSDRVVGTQLTINQFTKNIINYYNNIGSS